MSGGDVMSASHILIADALPFPLIQPAFLTPPVEHSVEIPQQIFDNWCWAAVVSGLEAFFNVPAPRSQCRIVNDVLGTGACCPEAQANVSLCNVPSAPQPALGNLFIERVDAANGGTDFEFVKQELVERGLPFLANLGFNNARVGHLVVVSGFTRRGSVIDLIVWDPYTGERSRERMRAFQRAFRDKGGWRASYRLQRPQ
jgi:hypothetical protein